MARTPQQPRVVYSGLSGHAYVLTRYHQDGERLIAITKHDVTEDVVRDLMAAAWARGWNECNAAEAGAQPPNPYRTARQPEPVERITDDRGDETEHGADTDAEAANQPQDGDDR